MIDAAALADVSNFVIEARNLMVEASSSYFVLIDWAAVSNPIGHGFQSISAVAAAILKYYSEDSTVAAVYLRDWFVEPLTSLAVVASLDF